MKRDDEMTGAIVFVGAPGRLRLVEVLVFSTLLDVALAVELNLEGERAGRFGTFAPSSMQRITT